MRWILWLFAPPAFCALTTLPAFCGDTPATLPERKAGLWELQTEMDEGNGSRAQKMTLCIDAQMERNTVLASIADHKTNCSAYDITTRSGSIIVDSDCLYNGRKVTSTTNMSGDFKSSFTITIQSTTSEPEHTDQSVVVKRTITQLGKYVGQSCGDLKPGEAQAPDGTRILVQ